MSYLTLHVNSKNKEKVHPMKISKISVMAALLLSLVQVNAFAEISVEGEKAKQVVVDYFSALNKSDVKKIVSLYHKNSVFLPNNAPASRGIEEIEKTYQAVLNTIKLNTTHIYHHVSVSGGIAVVESKANGNLTVLETKEISPANDNELFVLKKVNGNWKIDRYMFNSSEHH